MKTLPEIIVSAYDWTVGNKEKSDRTSGSRLSFNGDHTIPAIPGVDVDVMAERVDSNIATATRIITATVSELPLKVMRVETAGGERQLIEDNDHESAGLLETPNETHTRSEIIEHKAMSLILAGNSYCGLENVKEQEGISEIWPLEPWKVEVKTDSNGMLSGYAFNRGMGDKTPYDREDMLHLRLYNINDPFYGRSRVQPIKTEILTNYYIKKYNEVFFKNGVSVSKVMSPKDGIALTDTQRDYLKKQLDSRHAGYENAFKLFLSSIPMELSDMAESHKDISFLEFLKFNRETILGALGIPPVLAGILEFSSYANALMQERTYWQHTIKPLLRIIENGLNKQLLWRHYDKDHVVQFDLSGVEALQENALEQAKTLQILVVGGIMTPNEARAVKGLAEVEGGDELKQPAKLDPKQFEEDESDESDDATDDDEKSLPVQQGVISKQSKAKYAKRIKAFELRTATEEKGFQGVMSKYFVGQSKRVRKALDAYTVNGRFTSRLQVWTKAGPQNPDPIFDLNVEEAALASAVMDEFRDVFGRAAGDVYAELGLDIAFSQNSVLVEVAASEFFNRLKRVNETTYRSIQDLLVRSTADGSGIKEISKGIREMFTEFSRKRSELIARTEMTGLVNRGSLIAYQQAGIEKKIWLTTQDSATRHSHSIADGEIVLVDQQFQQTGWPMSAPGDPSAPVGETANCRCTVAPHIEV